MKIAHSVRFYNDYKWFWEFEILFLDQLLHKISLLTCVSKYTNRAVLAILTGRFQFSKQKNHEMNLIFQIQHSLIYVKNKFSVSDFI